MNDPGLDEPILDTADRVTGTYNEPQQSTSQQSGRQRDSDGRSKPEQGYTDVEKRWWILSTAFPLIAGTLGPLANLFSVCALVQTWRIKVPDGTRISDPKWILALNSTSLAFAIAANLFLLFNFAHRIRYTVAQPLTITLWYISAVLLIIPLGSIHNLSSSSIHHTLSQSYFYAILGVILYIFISTLLLLHYLESLIFRHRPDPPSFDHLTIPQRTLMLQTISFTLYLALGAGVYAAAEGQSFVDSVYWADYTLLTIGLGSDFPPQTSVIRGLLIPYAGGGLVIIGLVVGSIRGLVLDRAEERVMKRRLSKEREKWIEKMKGREQKEKTGKSTEWRKAEFEAMRKALDRAQKVRRYTALGVSFFAFLVLWFIGALVFWFTETNQQWTYPTTLYFTYTTLLTIGYGDFVPMSNSGKPFFVLWSLIAVPTVTILISNMGSTVVRWVEKGTVWLGRWTVLPEKRGGSRGDVHNAEPDHRRSKVEEQHFKGEVEKIGGAVERAEVEHGDATSLAAKLAKEIRGLAEDLGSKPPKKYSWEDWKKWMKLLEQNDSHQTMNDSDDSGKQWVWLGEDGPLFSRIGETEWILGKLCEKLEEVLEERVTSKK